MARAPNYAYQVIAYGDADVCSQDVDEIDIGGGLGEEDEVDGMDQRRNKVKIMVCDRSDRLDGDGRARYDAAQAGRYLKVIRRGWWEFSNQSS